MNEVCAAIPNTPGPDPYGISFVITSNFPKGGNYCAWHSYGTCDGSQIAVVYLPNVTGVSGCEISSSANTYSSAAQSMVNIAAHELSETITDPFLNAWYDSSGQEVGDKCAWQFGAPVLLGTTSWQLQEEWSNANKGCVQTYP